MEPEKKSNGALVGLIIIVIILIIGGLYVWQTNKNVIKNGGEQPTETLSEEDTLDLENLDQETSTLETDIGVDVDSIN